MKKLFVVCILILSVACKKSAPPANNTPAINDVPTSAEITTDHRAPEYFGMNVLNKPGAFPTLVKFSSYRWWDDGAQAVDLNTAPGKFNFAPVDNLVDSLGRQHVTDGLYELGRPPAWMRPSLGVGTDQAWRDWVAAIGSHFKAFRLSPKYGDYHITGWSPYNEFTYTASGWTGTNDQMVRMAEDARCILTGRGAITVTHESCADVLKAVHLNAPIDPSSTMLSPSFGFGNDLWKNYFATPGADAAAEAIEFHCYLPTAAGCLQQFTNLQARFSSKKIWIGEVSWGPNSLLTDQEKADFLRAIYMQAKVERVYDYAYNHPQVGTLYLNGKLTKAGEMLNSLQGSTF